jgi:hypothetical protein
MNYETKFAVAAIKNYELYNFYFHPKRFEIQHSTPSVEHFDHKSVKLFLYVYFYASKSFIRSIETKK